MRATAWLGVLGGRHALAGRRHGAEEDPAEGLLHRVVELVGGGLEHGADDLLDDAVAGALLLLTEPLVAEDRGAVLDDHALVDRVLHDLEELPQPRSRLLPRVFVAPQGLDLIFFDASSSTEAKTASKTPCLPLKWW